MLYSSREKKTNQEKNKTNKMPTKLEISIEDSQWSSQF